MYNRLALKRLERLTEAEGIRFYDLPTEISNSLRLRPYLRVVTLLKQTDPLLKFEVFLRLNKGGEALNAQEIRKVAFMGPLSDAIYALADTPFLKAQLKITNDRSSAFRDMADAEFVLRFLTLTMRLNNFSGSLVKEMDEFMVKYRYVRPEDLLDLMNSFTSALERCESLWSDKAFRRPEKDGWRDQTLAGMYDAQMIAVGYLSEEQFETAVAHRDAVVDRTRQLFADPEFDTAVRVGTNTPNRIRYRVKKMREALVF
jgi:hypothetical protein